MTDFLDSEAEQRQFFEAQTPTGLDLALARLVFGAYPRAQEFCESIAAPEEDHDLRGHVRRAMLDGSLLSLMGRFPVSVAPVRNSSGTQDHREVAYGPIILCVSHLRHKRERLRESLFRDGLARLQTPFFPSPEALAFTVEPILFAVLIHGSPSPFDEAPDFVNIVFPVTGGLHGLGIDLMTKYPSLAPKPITPPEFGKGRPELRPDIELPDEREEGEGAGGA